MSILDELETEHGRPAPSGSVEPQPPELSLPRITVLVLVLAGLAFGAWKLVSNSTTPAMAKVVSPVYAPYVDVTLTPTYQFQLPSENPVSSAYLGFIVSRPSSPCTPSWGGYYTMAQADQTLDLASRVAQLRAQGGEAMISFGGLLNSELAAACTSTSALEHAYLSVITRYHVNTIDFDLEGATLADQTADVRRADVIAAIQKRLAKQHKSLHVWITLPVSAQGLTAAGMTAVRTMFNAHVDVEGVNVMAMDFGSGSGAATNMFATVKRSLYASHGQLESIWGEGGKGTSSAAAWQDMGVTVMLGVNDITNERFTIADAKQLAAFVNRQGIQRVSVWSLNRDSECGAAFPITGTLSNTCSGVVQTSLEFTHIFSHLRGTKTAHNNTSSVAPAASSETTTTDNPATSPYPIWTSTSAYVTGYKVVWQGQIYQANWWSQGTPPQSTDADSTTGSPWLLIGPVPAGSKGFKPVLTASTKQPPWSATTVYQEGARVEFDGLPYRARWYTKGDQPLDQLPGNPNSPWEPLFKAPGEPTDTGIGSGQS